MRFDRRQFLLSNLGAAAAAFGTARAFAAGYPERPITFICPWPAGGTADVTMRALCTAAAKELGQSVVVDNKAGASGMIGLRALASARPDGYTVGQIPISVTRFAQLGTVQIDPLHRTRLGPDLRDRGAQRGALEDAEGPGGRRQGHP